MKSIVKHSISAAAAGRIVAAAEKKAQEIGVPMAIAVTDEGGTLKAFLRMDGAALLAVDVAKDKAYTATAFGMATDQWFDFIKDDAPLLHGVTKVPRLIVFGGGYPIIEDGAVIGAIGVSGGHYSQDMEVARTALENC
nr:heme-binding protein [Sphingomonas sp. Y57]